MTDHTAGGPATPFRVAFVPGVTVGKWARAWAERVPEVPLELVPVSEFEQLSVLRERRADMSFVRLPVDDDQLRLIPLYREVPVVVVRTDHVLAAFDVVDIADLATETSVVAGSPKEAIELVAISGTGVVVVPQSVARLYRRKDVTHVPVTGVAESRIGLTWWAGTTDERIDTFIGIVRGRTARSSRGEQPPPKPPAEKRTPAAKRKPAANRRSRGKPGRGRQGR